MCTLAGHFADIKKNLDRTIESYNKAVASVESSVLVTARKFKDLGAGSPQELEVLDTIERATRELQAPEFDHVPA